MLFLYVVFYVRILSFFRDGSVLAVDLGHLKVVSNLASRDTSVRVSINKLILTYKEK